MTDAKALEVVGWLRKHDDRKSWGIWLAKPEPKERWQVEPLVRQSDALEALQSQLAEMEASVDRAEANQAAWVEIAEERAAVIEALQVQAEKDAEALRKIAAYGDPYEIADAPEDFGGTDDGTETVCMAYENMQSIAQARLADRTGEV